MGDIHQPLHCGFKSNEGGNLITGSFLGTATELHAVWDNGIIQQRLLDFSGSYDNYAAYLVQQLKGSWSSDIAKWTTCMKPNDPTCVQDWGTESAGLACTYAYTDSTGECVLPSWFIDLCVSPPPHSLACRRPHSGWL
jgi:hypothetical protein